jgi:DNA-binding response OmpR family regulator
MALAATLSRQERAEEQMTLLIVDDEPAITETLEAKFRKEGYTTFVADSAEEGMRLFKKVKPDLIILDIMLPNRSGHDLCKAIRREHQTPIVFVSAKASEEDRILGLEMGADDYVTKPYNMTELAARVKAILRRSGGETTSEFIQRGDLKIDPKTHQITLGERPIQVSPKEFALLYFMARNAGQVFTREALLDRVWGKDAYVTSRTVDVHIRWLRTHIEKDPNLPERLITVRGVGYKFNG